MTAKTGSAAREKTATGRSDGGSPRAGTAEQLNRADLVAQRRAGGSLRPTGSASQASPATRQMVVYGIAAYALARLPFDRRFQTNVITWVLGLAVGKSAVRAATRNLIVGTERYYLHVKPGWLHRRRRRRQRRHVKPGWLHRRRRRRPAARG